MYSSTQHQKTHKSNIETSSETRPVCLIDKESNQITLDLGHPTLAAKLYTPLVITSNIMLACFALPCVALF